MTTLSCLGILEEVDKEEEVEEGEVEEEVFRERDRGACLVVRRSVATPAETPTRGRNRAAANDGRKKKRGDSVMAVILEVENGDGYYYCCCFWFCKFGRGG